MCIPFVSYLLYPISCFWIWGSTGWCWAWIPDQHGANCLQPCGNLLSFLRHRHHHGDDGCDDFDEKKSHWHAIFPLSSQLTPLSTLLGSGGDGDGAGRYMSCYIITVKHCATVQLSVMIPANKKQGGENGRIVTVAKPGPVSRAAHSYHRMMEAVTAMQWSSSWDLQYTEQIFSFPDKTADVNLCRCVAFSIGRNIDPIVGLRLIQPTDASFVDCGVLVLPTVSIAQLHNGTIAQFTVTVQCTTVLLQYSESTLLNCALQPYIIGINPNFIVGDHQHLIDFIRSSILVLGGHIVEISMGTVVDADGDLISSQPWSSWSILIITRWSMASNGDIGYWGHCEAADHGNGGLKTACRKTVDRLISCRIKGIKYLIWRPARPVVNHHLTGQTLKAERKPQNSLGLCPRIHNKLMI